MASTYEKIATQTLSSAASTITLSSIPATYTDIVLVFTGGTTASTGVYIQFNGDTGSNYSFTKMYGFGSNKGSGLASNVSRAEIGGCWTASGDVHILNIQNYSNTSTYKTTLYRANDATDTVTAGVALWRSTSAINQVLLSLDSTTFTSGSNITIYGIKAE
jgi:hypothetical protein